MFLSVIQIPAPRKEIIGTVRVLSPTALPTIVAPTIRATVSELRNAPTHSLTSYAISEMVVVKPSTATPL